MTDKTDEQTTQPSLINPPPLEIGQTVVIGNRGGKVLKISDNGKSVKVKFILTDGGISERWEYISDIDGQNPQPDIAGDDTVGAQHASPDDDNDMGFSDISTDETVQLNKQIASLRAQLERAEKERDEQDIAKQSAQFKLRQALAKQTDEEKTEVEKSTGTFGELKVAQDEIVKLTARVFELENPPLPQRPLVEVKKLSREIAFDSVVHDDMELAKWFAEGYEIIPALSKITFINNQTGSEHITFQRTNRQPIQPHYPQPSDSLAEINQAFDAQAQRDNAIISRTPYTDLLRQGAGTEEIIQAAQNNAVIKARAAGLASQASHAPTTKPAFLLGGITQ